VILCGGLGTRIKEETELRPKPMVPIGNQPILWHVMQSYARHGFKRFILCLGFKSAVIKEYFLNFSALQSDFTVELKSRNVLFHTLGHTHDWTVTLADTGESAMTGARVARAAGKYLAGAAHFAVTYGDGLTDADLRRELEFHLSHGQLGTVLGVNPPSRFGELKLDGEAVTNFAEKPEFEDEWINGGYFFFKNDFLKYLDTEESCVLERGPLVRLARDHQLRMFKHRGFWACMDTQRDRDALNKIYAAGQAPWLGGFGVR
jgi:glucose-1-phosphate cytidylyltransferase